MSVNISIKEGDVSRIFANVSKLTVNRADDSGGTVDFIPEMEADDYATLTELTAKTNGTYYAKEHNAAGFSKVVINVPAGAGSKDNATVFDSLMTNLSAIAVRPNIHQTATSYEWNGGRDPQTGDPIRTFTSTTQQPFNEYIEIAGKNIKYYVQQVVEPSSYSSIPDSDVDMLTINNQQLFWVSIADFSKGFTLTSPRKYDDKVSTYVEDMYKVRTLKTIGTKRTVLNAYTQTTTQTVGVDTVFNTNAGVELGGNADVNYTETNAERVFEMSVKATNGNKYGIRIKENKTTGEVTRIRLENGVEFAEPLFKVYASQADADADIGNVPAGTIAIIQLGGGS